MALTIVVRSGDSASPPTISFDAPRIVVGRADGCEVRLPDPSVSHRHASIRQRGADYIVVDESSTNGTFVGPVRLPPQTPRVLKDGDLVRVGRIWIEVRIEQALPTSYSSLATKELALALVAEALSAQGEPAAARVRVVSGPGSGQTLSLDEPGRAYVVGRGKKGVALTLDDDDLSRRHAEIERRADRVFVRDLGSKNGTRIAEETLDPDGEHPWPREATVSIGGSTLELDDPVADALAELERAADERLREDEPIDPPVNLDGNGPDATVEETVEAPADQAVERARADRPSARASPTPTGWSGTDYLVATLAVVVLASSLAALFWLIRSG